MRAVSESTQPVPAALVQPPPPVVVEEPALPFGEIIPLDAAVPASGMRFSPALCLVRDLPIGSRIDLGASGLPVQVENRTDQAMELSLRAVSPTAFGISSWERGYEPIPDPSWLSLEPDHVSLPPRTRMLVRPVLNLPATVDMANRRFMVGILLAPGGTGGSVGAGLAVCGRLQLETQASDEAKANAAQPLGFAPAVARAAIASGVSTRVVRLRNNQDATLHWELRPLADAIVLADRRLRYVAPGLTSASGWSVPQPASGELAAGQEVAITFTTTVPDGLNPGTYEEIWFAGDPAELDLAGSTDATHQPACGFVRLHHLLGTPR